LELNEDDVIITVATDSAALYASERQKFAASNYSDGFDEVNAGEEFGQHLLGAADNNVLELTHAERSRIFNLGYFTWVEQQGVSLEDFESRRSQRFWQGLRAAASAWDELIAEFNARAGFGADC
jgi:cysteine synthase A